MKLFNIFNKGKSGLDNKTIQPTKEISTSTPNYSTEIESFIFLKNNKTVEQSITSKSSQFYGSILNNDLKEMLIEDFTQMELAFIRNDYLEFARRMHKQYEAIRNYILADIRTLPVIENELKNLNAVFVSSAQNYPTKKLGELLFHPVRYNELVSGKTQTGSNAESLKLSEILNNKYVNTLFYYYYFNLPNKHSGLINFNISSKSDRDVLEFTNIARVAASHGWVKLTQDQQNILNTIKNNSTSFYFQSLGYLNFIRSHPNIVAAIG
jgi:hypothetical protein